MKYIDGINLYSNKYVVTRTDPFGNLREEVAQVLAVGPIDALTARNLANEALGAARESGLPGQHNGDADAYRHCFWSCRMTQEIGEGQAEEVGNIHEQYGDNPVGEDSMDRSNNASGRAAGAKCDLKKNDTTQERQQYCRDACMSAWENGELVLSPDIATEEYYEDYQ